MAEELGVELRLVRNKGALMVLPAGVDKGTGAREALRELNIDPADCVTVGDAENDLDLLALCGLLVAVANAAPAVKLMAGLVTEGEAGEGVAELITRLLAGELGWPVLKT